MLLGFGFIHGLTSTQFEELERLSGKGRSPVEVILIGSSYLEAVQADIVEKELAKMGIPLRVVNLSAKGMRMVEAEALLRVALETELPQLKHIFVDFSTAHYRPIVTKNAHKPRTVRWHDLEALRHLWNIFPHTVYARLNPTTYFVSHLKHFALRSLYVGEGLSYAGRLAGNKTHPVGTLKHLVSTSVYRSDDREERKKSQLQAAIARLNKHRGPRSSHPAKTYFARTFSSLAKRHGATLSLVFSPVAFRSSGPSEKVFAELDLNGLDFQRPPLFPELYRPEVREDDLHHLNAAGEVLYSKLFARELMKNVVN